MHNNSWLVMNIWLNKQLNKSFVLLIKRNTKIKKKRLLISNTTNLFINICASVTLACVFLH